MTQLLDEACTRYKLSPQDRRLATELTYGVVRRRATLDAVLACFLSRPRENIEDGLWRLLQLGTYQLVLLSGIPPHAAVSETVLLAKQLGKPRWSGFLNGVLRNIARELTDQFETAPTPRGVPLSESSSEAQADDSPIRYRLLAGDIFPDPQQHPAGYLAAAFSFPDWLVDRWLSRFRWDEILRICHWFNSPGRLTLRVNRLQTDRDRLLGQLRDADVAAEPGIVPDSIHLLQSARVESLPGFTDGAFSVQDESAQQAALQLDPQPSESILDLCAAPGGKTTHLAELMQDQGRIIACDSHAERLQRVTENTERLQLTCIETRFLAPDGTGLPDGPFDATLVDVPCSNTGVLGKRPDARWRIKPDDLNELPQIQSRLLQAAAARTQPGGRILYSTCSIEPEENEQVVAQALNDNPALELVCATHHVPGCPGDGGYQALLRRH